MFYPPFLDKHLELITIERWSAVSFYDLRYSPLAKEMIQLGLQWFESARCLLTNVHPARIAVDAHHVMVTSQLEEVNGNHFKWEFRTRWIQSRFIWLRRRYPLARPALCPLLRDSGVHSGPEKPIAGAALHTDFTLMRGVQTVQYLTAE